MKTKFFISFLKGGILMSTFFLLSAHSHAVGLLLGAPDLGYVGKDGQRLLAFKDGRHIIFRVCADNAYLGDSVEDARNNCKTKKGTKDIRVYEKALTRELPKILARTLGNTDQDFEKQIRDLLFGQGQATPELKLKRLKELEGRLADLRKSKEKYGDSSVTPGLEEKLEKEIKKLNEITSNLDSEVENLQKIMKDIADNKLEVDIAAAREEQHVGKSITLLDLVTHFDQNPLARYGTDADVAAMLKQVIFKEVISDSDKKEHIFDGTETIMMQEIQEDGKVKMIPKKFKGTIKAVKFVMGSPDGEGKEPKEEGRDTDEIQHVVYLTKNFSMGETEVTQKQWREILELASSKGIDTQELDLNPSRFSGDNRPVEKVSWNDIKKFIGILNELTKDSGYEYRLPTEAEWEYAARGGKSTPFGIGDGKNISAEQANFDGNHPYGNGAKGKYRQETVAAKSLPNKNAYGLYDMHGNVWEWTSDLYSEYSRNPTFDPVQEQAGPDRVIRGGSWNDHALGLRSASRVKLHPGDSWSNVGLRLVRTSR